MESIQNVDYYSWRSATISQILTNRVYTGELISLKTETQNCKTKQRGPAPEDQRIVTPNAHDAIISTETFRKVQLIRSQHRCPAQYQRDNIFRGKLFCECCGHPLTLSQKSLKAGQKDIYICMYHYSRPDICPKTHRIYHDILCAYVLKQIQQFGKSMNRRKVNFSIGQYSTVEKNTPQIIDEIIDRIEVGHTTPNSKPCKVICIRWKLK